MSSTVTILPAILAPTKAAFQKEVKRIEGVFPWIHIDIADSTLIKGKTLSLVDALAVDVSAKREVHLMVKDPEQYLTDLIDAKVERVIVHVESDGNKDAMIRAIKSANLEVYFGVLADSIVYPVRPYLKDVDGVVVLAVNAGKQGSPFLPVSLDKVRLVHTWYPDMPIEVDGGMQPKTAQEAVKMGASRIAVGSFLKKAKKIITGVNQLQEAFDRGMAARDHTQE
ncbi:MAG: hypothetical protein Q8R11_04085 [bacterium]|nr:hypothetical protein [bacterium]